MAMLDIWRASGWAPGLSADMAAVGSGEGVVMEQIGEGVKGGKGTGDGVGTGWGRGGGEEWCGDAEREG